MGAKIFSGLFIMYFFVSSIGCKKDKPFVNEVSQIKAKQKVILSMTSFDEVEVDDILDIVVESDAENNEGGIITYKVVAAIGAGSATVDQDGVLKALEEGVVSVIASSDGDENYLSASVSKTITILPKPVLYKVSDSKGSASAAATQTGISASGSKPAKSQANPNGSSTAPTQTPIKKGSTPTKVIGSTPTPQSAVVTFSPVSGPEKGIKPLPVPTSPPIQTLKIEPISLSANQMLALSVLTIGDQHELVVQNLAGRRLKVEKIRGEGNIHWNGSQIIGKKAGFVTLKIIAEKSSSVDEHSFEFGMNVVAPDLNSSATGKFIFQNDFASGSATSHYGARNAPKIKLASSDKGSKKYVVIVYQNDRVFFVGKGESANDKIYILGDASPNKMPDKGQFNIVILTVAKNKKRDDVIPRLKDRFNLFALPVIIEYGNKIATSPLIEDAEIMICNRQL